VEASGFSAHSSELILGRAIVIQFVQDSCSRLVITDIVEDTLYETAKLAKEVNHDISVETIVGDVSSLEFVEQLMSHVMSSFGRLDYGVNCAGISGTATATGEMDFEDYRKVQRVNADGLWLCERGEPHQTW
jgi:NAD(P)-dependent dehydrogenase (short-subunit alcohol dehydrogenase family)